MVGTLSIGRSGETPELPMSNISSSSQPKLDVMLREIESHDFAVSLGIAGTERLFEELLATHSKVVTLLEEISNDPSLVSILINRIRSIQQLNHDPTYTNPYDTALAVYLWVLNFGAVDQPELARFAASEVLKINDLWWARNFALKLNEDGHEKGRITPHVIPVSFGDDEVRKRRRSLVHYNNALSIRKRLIASFSSELRPGPVRIVRGHPFVTSEKFKVSRWGRRLQAGLVVKRGRTRTVSKQTAWSNQ